MLTNNSTTVHSLLSPSPLMMEFSRGKITLFYFIAILSIFLLLNHLVLSDSQSFEGFDLDEFEDDVIVHPDDDVISHSLRSTPLSTESDAHTPPDPNPDPKPDPILHPDLAPKPSSSSFEYWDEDEFEGLPVVDDESQHREESPPESEKITENVTPGGSDDAEKAKKIPFSIRDYVIEIVCVSFLIMFLINYFTGKKENERLALAWAAKFAAKDTIFDKNFSLLGVGDGDDSPLLLKEGNTVFKFYASGRRFCQGVLATMELKSRHDLISRLFNMVVPCKDEITFEVYMNDESMDHIVLALAKKKAAKSMHKEDRDLNRYANLMSTPANRKWVAEELAVISESKEVAGDLISEVVLDQVFGEKAYEKFGKGFISMHFSDQEVGTHKKMMLFKFALPDVNNMADMSRLVALIPYYIDLIGRYKLSPQARSKTEAARSKAASEAYKELQNARQEALQKKKLEKKKMMEEIEAKLGAEALRKKEAKDRAKNMKKAMPKMKMTRSH